MKVGEYMPLAVTTRQNGTIMTSAMVFLSLFNFTLLERFTLSFHLIRLANNDGKISMIFRRKQMMMTTESSVTISENGDVVGVMRN